MPYRRNYLTPPPAAANSTTRTTLRVYAWIKKLATLAIGNKCRLPQPVASRYSYQSTKTSCLTGAKCYYTMC